MLPAVPNGALPTASHSKALRAKLKLVPYPVPRKREFSTQDERKLPSINVSIFQNSPVRSAFEKIDLSQEPSQVCTPKKLHHRESSELFMTKLQSQTMVTEQTSLTNQLHMPKCHFNSREIQLFCSSQKQGWIRKSVSRNQGDKHSNSKPRCIPYSQYIWSDTVYRWSAGVL
jgi:hypothetical protein